MVCQHCSDPMHMLYCWLIFRQQSSKVVLSSPYCTKRSVVANPLYLYCPVQWGCRICWWHLCSWVRPPPPNQVSWISKPSDGEAPVLEFGIWSTLSLTSIPVWDPVRVPSLDQKELWICLRSWDVYLLNLFVASSTWNKVNF